jgi:hypothetical protein
MTKPEIQKELEALTNRAYRDQPDMTGTMIGLLQLLACSNCEHELETKTQPDSPAGPAETFIVCRKCGYEPSDE